MIRPLAANRNGLTDFERAYSYDGIGNRLSATDHTGAATNYFADTGGTTTGGNVLNQYAKINYPGSTTLQPVHDTDGNMTSGPVPGINGLSPGVPIPANAALTWDAENRLVKAVVNSSTIHYDYDHQSRLISRSVGVSPTSATRYLYDGWNRIAEYESNGTGHTLKRSYLWGMDLSESMQGAGGVGGLLSMTVHETTSATFYPTYDGNGNISEYVNQSGTREAHFEYDPFGNLTVDRDSNAAEFPYRFSTKPQDSVTGLLYYGYRYYDPVTGRWPSRDPIKESGGVNLYAFVENDVVNWIDAFGLEALPPGVTRGNNLPLPDGMTPYQNQRPDEPPIDLAWPLPVQVTCTCQKTITCGCCPERLNCGDANVSGTGTAYSWVGNRMTARANALYRAQFNWIGYASSACQNKTCPRAGNLCTPNDLTPPESISCTCTYSTPA